MDPKNLPSLDPKLKEAYDRVMSTSLPQTPPTPTQPAPQAPTPPTTPEPVAAPTTPAPVATPAQSTLPPIPTTAVQPAAPTNVVTPTPAYTTLSAPEPATTHSSTFVAGAAHTAPSKSKISPVLLIVLGVVFFAVYSLFWLRFFNVPLPFLP